MYVYVSLYMVQTSNLNWYNEVHNVYYFWREESYVRKISQKQTDSILAF